MASKLPIEILEKVFRNFLQVESTPYNSQNNEYSTGDLHSCLLVNWQWCETVVPLLWSDPFRQSASIAKQHDKILDTQGIPKMNMYTPNTMYDYPFFAKHIDVGAMIYVAKTWCVRNRLPYRESAIVTVILKLMRRNGATIERLSGPFRFTTRPEFLSLFQQNPELEMWISSVKSCHMVWNDNMMIDRNVQKQYTMATLSNHLECLDLNMKGIQTFTQKRNLATIGATMRQFHSLNQFIGRSCGGDLNAIVSNLKLSASTLLDIEFADTNFKDSAPLNSLLIFDNLEVLTFRNCDFLTLRVMQPLMTVPFCHLKQLRQVNILHCHDVSEHVRDWADEVNRRSYYAC
ncbi:12515_t:CDS:2 [Ambispora gerdemannii]|uniref:12515_t:CDS:1 n=1 Tax=Ambispora gerdemannii TaxID=144530 RepID=A0A9N8ZVE5_9GLOM|nr:12515_t:CDS:2 [Ambispora gerdemannii]